MKSDTFVSITGEEESRPVDDLSPPGSVHEYPSPTDATGAAVAQEADSSAPGAEEQQQATGEAVVSCSVDQPRSSSPSSNDVNGNRANDQASGGSSSINVEMSVNSSYSRVDDKLRITIDLSVPMRSVSRHIDGVNVKLVDSEFGKGVRLSDEHRQSRLQPRCSLTSKYERPIIPMMNELEFEWNEYRRRPSMPDISVDVNVNGDAGSGSEAAAAAAAAPAPQKPPRQQATPEPPTQNEPSLEANARAVQEEAPRRTRFDVEDIEKMLGIIPRVEKPSLLDKPGPVGAFAQTSNFVMNEPLKKMVEKQQQIRDQARATSRPAAAAEAAVSVPAPVAFRDRRLLRSDQTDSRSTTTSATTTTTTTATTKTKTSSTQNDPPSYSACVTQNDPTQNQRPSLIHYAPPSYSAAITQQFQQELQSSTESFMSLLEQKQTSSSSAAETEAGSSTPRLATFLKPPRTSPRPMISPSAPPHPANPEAEFYNHVIETAMKRAGPFANQLDIKTVLASARYPLIPEPWVPPVMRPYIVGNEEPYKGPETGAEYLERVAEARGAPVAAVPAQQRPPQRTADLAGDQGAVPRPPAPRTPKPDLRVEASPPAYQPSDYDLRVQRAPSAAQRSDYDVRVQRAPSAAQQSDYDLRVQRAPSAARRSEWDLRTFRSPPASPPNGLELDPSVVCDLGSDLRNSLTRAGLPLDLQNLSEAQYDRALIEMHRVMERAKSMLQNLRK